MATEMCVQITEIVKKTRMLYNNNGLKLNLNLDKKVQETPAVSK